MRQEAELAADDAVVSSGADAGDYAAQLVSAARGGETAAVAMVRASVLGQRVRSILDPRVRREAASGRARARLLVLSALLGLMLSACATTRVYRAGQKGVVPPKVASRVEPGYSEQARDEKKQGTVIVRCVISEAGVAENIIVSRPLGSGLDEKAVEAIRQWRFHPGTRNGKAVKVSAVIEVNFRLL